MFYVYLYKFMENVLWAEITSVYHNMKEVIPIWTQFTWSQEVF